MTSIKTSLNSLICAILLSLQAFLLFGLPFLLPEHSWLMLLAVILLPMNSIIWGMIHEAVHRIGLPKAKANDAMGRVLSIGFGVPFDVLKFGHLMHHRFKRDWESEIKPRNPTIMDKVAYYTKICGGMHFMSLVSAIGFLLPKPIAARLMQNYAQKELSHLPDIETIANQYFFKPARLRHIRIDMLAIIGIYGLSAFFYGAYWPVLAMIVLGRAFIISFMDNIYHYGTPADNSQAAHEVGLPAPIERLILNGNYHHTHHALPKVPWHALPNVKKFAADMSFTQAFKAQWHGPLTKKSYL